MKLHHYAHSSASYRVRIALALKGIDIDYAYVDMRQREHVSEAYKALNPQGIVPCLELDDGSVLGQSIAIIDYLDHLQPEPSLYPASPATARHQARSLMLLIACETSPLQTVIVQRHLASEFGLDDKQVNSWTTFWIRRGLAPVEHFLQERADQTPFAFGDSPSVVDIFLVPQLYNAARFGVDLSDLTAINSVNANCLQHPAFLAAHPQNWE